ncbi:hypothetical protein KAI04_04495 [Candidatus Pacearchaeota archaeon]|nr:hypothetical protein [Candidatus Pacearchaeota archaeon]
MKKKSLLKNILLAGAITVFSLSNNIVNAQPRMMGPLPRELAQIKFSDEEITKYNYLLRNSPETLEREINRYFLKEQHETALNLTKKAMVYYYHAGDRNKFSKLQSTLNKIKKEDNFAKSMDLGISKDLLNRVCVDYYLYGAIEDSLSLKGEGILSSRGKIVDFVRMSLKESAKYKFENEKIEFFPIENSDYENRVLLKYSGSFKPKKIEKRLLGILKEKS